MDKNTIKTLLEAVTKKDLSFSEFSDEEKKAVVSLMHQLRDYQRSNIPNNSSVEVLKSHYARLPKDLKEFIKPAKNKLKKLFYGAAVYGLEDIRPNQSDKICLFTNNKDVSDKFGAITVSGADISSYDTAIDLNKLNSFSGSMLRDADKVRKHGTTRVSRNFDAMNQFIESNNLKLNIEVSDDNSEVVVIGVKYNPEFEASKKLNPVKDKELNESLDEVTKTTHYFKRYGQRVTGKDTTFSQEDPEVFNEVVSRLKVLDKVKFPEGWDVGILFWSGKKKYVMKSQSNAGSDLWGIIRSVDTITSLGWYPSGHLPKDLDQDKDGELFVTYELLEIILKKRTHGILNSDDMERLKYMMVTPHNVKKVKVMSMQPKSRPSHKRSNKGKVETDHTIFWRIDGVGWVLDPEKGIAYKKNKPDVNEPLEAFVEKHFEKANDSQQEKLMDIV